MYVCMYIKYEKSTENGYRKKWWMDEKNYKLQSIQLSSLFLLKRKRRGKPETEKICMCMQFAKKMFNWNDDNDDDDYKRNLRNKIENG